MALSAGTTFGPYEIVGAPGAGSMGEVFAEDPDRLARFERETKTPAALSHPSIAEPRP